MCKFQILNVFLFRQVSHLHKNNKVLTDIVIPENLHLLGSLEGQEGGFLSQASLILLLTVKWVHQSSRKFVTLSLELGSREVITREGI